MTPSDSVRHQADLLALKYHFFAERVLEATSYDAIALFLCCCATWIQCTGSLKTALLHLCIEKGGEQVV